MLAKLMKYELKATRRSFLPLFGAVIAIALINRLFQSFNTSPSYLGLLPSVFMNSIIWMLFAAIMVVALVITIQRFNKNLLQNEGYLSFTLPVRIELLIFSKLFISLFWYIASVIVLVVSLLLAYSFNITFSGIANAFSTIFNAWFSSGQSFLIGVELITISVLGAFSSILLIYTCLSLGTLVNNHRGLLAFGMYFTISTVLQFLASFIMAPLMMWVNTLNWSSFATSQFWLLFAIGFSLALCVAFFVTTRYILRHKLNLL